LNLIFLHIHNPHSRKPYIVDEFYLVLNTEDEGTILTSHPVRWNVHGYLHAL